MLGVSLHATVTNKETHVATELVDSVIKLYERGYILVWNLIA
jgi:hypothetical protein